MPPSLTTKIAVVTEVRVKQLAQTVVMTTLMCRNCGMSQNSRSEEHTSELQSHSDLHSFPARRSSDLTTKIAVVTEVRVKQLAQTVVMTTLMCRNCGMSQNS